MIEEELRLLLKAVVPQTAPLIAPSNWTPPFAVYSRVSTGRQADLDGPVGIAVATFRVDVYASTFAQVRTLANSVRVALDGLQTDTHYLTLENERDLSELEASPNLYRTNMEFRVTHEE